MKAVDLSRQVLLYSTIDEIVIPKESGWFEFYPLNSDSAVTPLKQSQWYQVPNSQQDDDMLILRCIFWFNSCTGRLAWIENFGHTRSIETVCCQVSASRLSKRKFAETYSIPTHCPIWTTQFQANWRQTWFILCR